SRIDYSKRVDTGQRLWLNPRPCAGVVGYPSGQRGQTVNLLAYAFAGSNPAPTTTSDFIRAATVKEAVQCYDIYQSRDRKGAVQYARARRARVPASRRTTPH